MPLVDTGCCQRCTLPFQIRQRIRAVFTARTWGRVPRAQLLEVERFAHAGACPSVTEISSMPSPALGPRTDSDTCVTCRKKFAPGDRLDIVYIVQETSNVGGQRGVQVSSEFELAHVVCPDPRLEGLVLWSAPVDGR